jgi:hypothetical protein
VYCNDRRHCGGAYFTSLPRRGVVRVRIDWDQDVGRGRTRRRDPCRRRCRLAIAPPRRTARPCGLETRSRPAGTISRRAP